jgi:hypothetical protein
VASSSNSQALRDPYPLGWVLTYLNRQPSKGPFDRLRVGVVTGSPLRDRGTGVDSVPLSRPGDTAVASVVWVPEGDIVGIEPRWPSQVSDVD